MTSDVPIPAEPDYDFSGLGFGSGQCAVVSGAASGIGRGITRILARSGVVVLAWDIDEAGLAALAAESAENGEDVRPLRVDGTNRDDIACAWAKVAGLPINFLANNAGPPSGSPLSVEGGIGLAVGGYAAMTEHFLAGHGETAQSIVFTASVAGSFMASPTNPDWYPAAKAGIVGYMRHLAVKHGGRPRANAVAPGFTVTARTASALSSPAVVEKLSRYPMGRGAYAWEVATMICFLLSPAASFINGVLVPVDGASTWTQ